MDVIISDIQCHRIENISMLCSWATNVACSQRCFTSMPQTSPWRFGMRKPQACYVIFHCFCGWRFNFWDSRTSVTLIFDWIFLVFLLNKKRLALLASGLLESLGHCQIEPCWALLLPIHHSDAWWIPGKHVCSNDSGKRASLYIVYKKIERMIISAIIAVRTVCLNLN